MSTKFSPRYIKPARSVVGELCGLLRARFERRAVLLRLRRQTKLRLLHGLVRGLDRAIAREIPATKEYTRAQQSNAVSNQLKASS